MSTQKSILQLTILNWRWWVLLPVALLMLIFAGILWLLKNFAEIILLGDEWAERAIKPYSSKMLKWVRGDKA
jgi:hypothetical protein